MVFNNLFKVVVIVLMFPAMILLNGCMAAPAASDAENEPAIAEQAATEAELEAQIREVDLAWEDAFHAGDLERLMEIYAEDAVSMPPNMPILEGKAAIEEDTRMFFEEFTVERQYSMVDVEVAGDMAFRRGEWTQTFRPKAGGDSITEVGKCIVVFKRFGDEWKLVLEIWNLDE